MNGGRRISSAMLLFCATATFAAEYAPIPRALPPKGIEIPAEKRDALTAEVAALRIRLAATKAKPEIASDVEVFLKAVQFALDLGEFYGPKDVAKAEHLLKVAGERLGQLEQGKTPWTKAKGLVVRGFVSKVDGSVQPYGLVIPEDVDLGPRKHELEELAPDELKARNLDVPLYVFLHGRGDQQTDLHFIEERLKSKGQITPPGAIVLHPFGRQCVGYKSAGETDVLEAVEHFEGNYSLFTNKVVLMGFSMGGAGAWHLGAHYDDRWAVVAPGAGFAETARYTKAKLDEIPWYEQKLWGCYDAPCSVRNLFDVKTIAYSGENDKQIQAARVMEEAFQAEGKTLDHRIGPGVEHKYEPETLKKILADIAVHFENPDNFEHPHHHWQGRTLRYASGSPLFSIGGAPLSHGSLFVTALEEHWVDSRLTRLPSGAYETKNIRAFVEYTGRIPKDDHGRRIATIDGQLVALPISEEDANGKLDLLPMTFVKGSNGWAVGNFPSKDGLFKIRGLQGPIDDAFLEPFLVVTPSGKSKHADFQRWQEFELQHFVERWKGLMRGELRIKADRDVTMLDLAKYHVILWGDPESNELLEKMVERLPVKFTDAEFDMNGKKYARNANAPMLIFPNPLATSDAEVTPEKNDWNIYKRLTTQTGGWMLNAKRNPKYIVLNSGLTFREAHDKTNSQQNPKLPDWAVVDLSQPPSAAAPGKIADAGFFDEEWRFKK